MAEGVNGELPLYTVSIHGTVHGWSICIVAVYMYGVKLLTNEFRRMSTVKTPEQRGAMLEDKHGGGTRHVTECTEGEVIIILITDNCRITLTICSYTIQSVYEAHSLAPLSFCTHHFILVPMEG